MKENTQIKNIAIIAHIDHGKTTLVDAILKHSNVFRSNEKEMDEELILDTGDLEKEKGITISAKNVSVRYKDYKINIIDTPGHTDFGGEVERTLNMAEGCILVVDAQEGPLIQTKVVLKKALALGLIPIVVINKIDKKNADCEKTLSKIQDLFLELAVNEQQLDFPVLYAIARDKKIFSSLPSKNEWENASENISPLLEEIIKIIPPTKGDPSGPFQMQISSLDYDNFNGRYLVGKITRGKIKPNDSLTIVNQDHIESSHGRVKKIFVREGLKLVEIEEATVGEVVSIIGIDSTAIGSTLCDKEHPDPHPDLLITPPSIEVRIEPNNSPFMGKEGKYVSARLLSKRLQKENESNVGIDIKTEGSASTRVYVRGELQLSILVETLRREGFEFQVRKPTVVFKKIDGVMMEPLEKLYINVPKSLASIIMQELSDCEAELVDMQTESERTSFTYKILTRNLFGLRNKLSTQTKGELVFNTTFLEYVPFKKQKKIYKKGMIVSSANGVSTAYALNMLQDRGDLLIGPAEKVYEGMIVGINKYDKELEVNPTKERKKSGVRMNQSEITQIALKSTLKLSMEASLGLLTDDEMLEVTPENIRLRKVYLTHTEREWAKRKNLSDIAKRKLSR